MQTPVWHTHLKYWQILFLSFHPVLESMKLHKVVAASLTKYISVISTNPRVIISKITLYSPVQTPSKYRDLSHSLMFSLTNSL